MRLVLLAPFLLFSVTAVSNGRTAGNEAAFPAAGNNLAPNSLLLDDAFIDDARNAINLLYNRQYEASLASLESWQLQHPDHPVWLLWESIEAWWPVLVDLENTSYDDDFLEVSNDVIDHCNRLLKNDPDNLDARIVRSIMYGQVARFHSNRHQWYRSFRNGRRALRDFFRIEETHPEIPDLNFGIGMYRYFAAFLLDEYPLARPIGWMLPRGDRQEGLERLKDAADESIFMEPEALFFLGHIYLHFEDQPDMALEYLERLYREFPDNTYYRRLYVQAHFHLMQFDEAREAIAESLDHWGDSRDHAVRVMREELLTIRGQIHFHYMRYEAAREDLVMAVNESESLRPFATRRNLITALYYLGEISVREGRRDDARYFFNRAATSDSEHRYGKQSLEALERYQLK